MSVLTTVWHIITLSQKTTLLQHTITSIQINQFLLFLAEMLQREYAIKRQAVISSPN